MNNKTKYFLLYSVLICSLSSVSFIVEGQISQLCFNRITLEDGLSSQSGNYYIFKDSENMIWISSLIGVNRFEGTSITSFLPNKIIQSNFFEGKQQRLWFGTDEEIMCYNRNDASFQSYQVKLDSLSEERYQGVYQLLFLDTINNYLWFRLGSNNQLYKYHIFDDDLIPLNQSINSIYAKVVSTKPKHYLVLIPELEKGLSLVPDPDPLKKPKSEIILEDYKITSFQYERKDTLWVAAGNQLFYYDLEGKKIKYSKKFNKNQIPSINGIANPGGNKLIISTPQNGIFFIDKNTFEVTSQIYSFDRGRSEAFTPSIDRIHLDSDQNLWVSSKNEGIYYTNLLKPKFIRHLTQFNYEMDSDYRVRSITQNNKGELLCLTSRNIKVIDWENKKIKTLEPFKNLHDKLTPFVLLSDDNNNLYCSSNYGFFVKKPNSAFFKKVLNSFVEPGKDKYNYIQKMTDGTLLISSFYSGLFVLNEKKEKFFLEKFSKIPNNNYGFTITFESSDDKLIAHKENKEILIYQKTDSVFHLLDSIPFTKLINGIAEDTIRKKWWLATDIGLFYIHQHLDSFRLIKDEFFPETIALRGIFLDSLNTLWISSNKGLQNYKPPFQEDPISFRHYSVSDGLQSLEFNLWSALELSNGKLAFGGVNGVNVFSPKEIKPFNVQPNPTIVKFEINNELSPEYLEDEKTKNKNVTQLKNIQLTYRQNNLRIEIAPLEYSDPSSIQYFFQLVSHTHGDTIIRQSSNTFDHPGLRPGTYTLTYNTSNSDGDMFDDKAKKLKIIIKPPWWKTKIAYFYYFLIFLSITYLYYRYRVGQIRKEEAFKRKEARFLQKEAEYKQLVAETETAILRLQMNPHFIFNSMNSISSYILQKDINTANDYLLRFAKLMRMILDFAEKPLISVAEEIELLEQYLKTELMRMQKKLKYNFELANGFDPDEYLIPTMILQPFVENAIWHGISNKKTKTGEVNIRFWITDEHLMCSIEDNGVGRKFTSTLNQHSKNYQSKAISITRQRLQMISSKNKIPATFEIKDLFDKDQSPIGTKVIFQLPIF